MFVFAVFVVCLLSESFLHSISSRTGSILTNSFYTFSFCYTFFQHVLALVMFIVLTLCAIFMTTFLSWYRLNCNFLIYQLKTMISTVTGIHVMFLVDTITQQCWLLGRLFLAHLSTKCSGWAIVIGLCPSSCVVRRASYVNFFT